MRSPSIFLWKIVNSEGMHNMHQLCILLEKKSNYTLFHSSPLFWCMVRKHTCFHGKLFLCQRWWFRGQRHLCMHGFYYLLQVNCSYKMAFVQAQNASHHEYCKFRWKGIIVRLCTITTWKYLAHRVASLSSPIQVFSCTHDRVYTLKFLSLEGLQSATWKRERSMSQSFHIARVHDIPCRTTADAVQSGFNYRNCLFAYTASGH